jgi:hypothetical protein
VKQKEFVYNEFGIGGGASVSGDSPARTVAQASDGPFFGVYGPYTRKLDPWRLFLPRECLAHEAAGSQDRGHSSWRCKTTASAARARLWTRAFPTTAGALVLLTTTNRILQCTCTPPSSAVNVLVGTRNYMYDWWTAATVWLARKGGPTWRVDHVFMWNLNSWDLQVGGKGRQPAGRDVINSRLTACSRKASAERACGL